MIIFVHCLTKVKTMEKQIRRHLARAEKALGEMESRCGAIAAMLQPHFKHEISVDFQPGDGFVVIWEDEAKLTEQAPNNVPVMDAVAAIKKDSSHFLN